MEQGYWTKAPAKTIYSLMTRLYCILANLISQPFECLTLCFHIGRHTRAATKQGTSSVRHREGAACVSVPGIIF